MKTKTLKFVVENEEWDKKSLKFFDSSKISWKDLALDVVAFANNKGGNIYFGIENKEDLPPNDQKITQQWQDEWFPLIKKNIQGNTENINPLIISCEIAQNGGEYIKIIITASRNSVACRNDGVYAIRFNDETHRLKPSELGHLFAEKNNFVWESSKTHFSFDLHDQITLSKLTKIIRNNEKVEDFIKQKSDFEICEYFHLAEDGYLTNLGIMWIGTKVIRAKIPNSLGLSVVFYDSNGNRSKPQKDWTDLQKTPLEILEEILELDVWKDGVDISDGVFRNFSFYYPKEVIKELITNAICHRAYTMGGDVFVNIYENQRIEVCSPSSLPVGITSENILHKQYCRNTKLAELSKALKMMEKLGSGYDKIYEQLLAQGQNPPTVFSDDDSVKVILDRQTPSPIVVNLMQKISEKFDFGIKEKMVLSLIASKDSLSTVEIASELKIATTDVKIWMGQLITQKIILGAGETKGKNYYVSPKILKELNHKKLTSLKLIPKPRLKALIIEDLISNPNSSISEIHERIGEEISRRKIRGFIYEMVLENILQTVGKLKHTKYSISSIE